MDAFMSVRRNARGQRAAPHRYAGLVGTACWVRTGRGAGDGRGGVAAERAPRGPYRRGPRGAARRDRLWARARLVVPSPRRDAGLLDRFLPGLLLTPHRPSVPRPP